MTTLQSVAGKQRKLATLRTSIRAGALDNLDHSQRVDITYTSNAIEGNTLTAGETALVLEKGITIGGKPLKDHLEAIDHARALDWVMDFAVSEPTITETDIRNLHRLVMARSGEDIAGRDADTARYVNTGEGVHHFPRPIELPALMHDFAAWLSATPAGPQTAFDAHRKLVGIHPFNDGNGRTARLLMNLVLLKAGFPAIAIRPQDRPTYLAAIETSQRGEGNAAFDGLMLDRLDKTLDLYLDAARQALPLKPGKTAS